MEIKEVSPQYLEAFAFGAVKPIHTLFYDLYWALEPWLPEAEFYSAFLKEYPEKNKRLQNLLYDKKRYEFEQQAYELCVDGICLSSDQMVSIYGKSVNSEKISIGYGTLSRRITALPAGIDTKPLIIPDDWRYSEMGFWDWIDATLADLLYFNHDFYKPQYEYPYALSLEEMHQLRERKIQIAKNITQILARYHGFVGICAYKYDDLMDTTDLIIDENVWYSLSDKRKVDAMYALIYSTWYFAFNKGDHPYAQSNYRLFQYMVRKGWLKKSLIEEDDDTVLICYGGDDGIGNPPRGFSWMDDEIFLRDKKEFILDKQTND